MRTTRATAHAVPGARHERASAHAAARPAAARRATTVAHGAAARVVAARVPTTRRGHCHTAYPARPLRVSEGVDGAAAISAAGHAILGKLVMASGAGRTRHARICHLLLRGLRSVEVAVAVAVHGHHSVVVLRHRRHLRARRTPVVTPPVVVPAGW